MKFSIWYAKKNVLDVNNNCYPVGGLGDTVMAGFTVSSVRFCLQSHKTLWQYRYQKSTQKTILFCQVNLHLFKKKIMFIQYNQLKCHSKKKRVSDRIWITHGYGRRITIYPWYGEVKNKIVAFGKAYTQESVPQTVLGVGGVVLSGTFFSYNWNTEEVLMQKSLHMRVWKFIFFFFIIIF